MSAQISRSVGIFTFASALSGFGPVTMSNTALAADCLIAPDPSAPPNGHWYYRTDRANQRKCWYLRGESQASEQAVRATGAVPPAKTSQSAWAVGSYSLASFKKFMAQQSGPKLSDQDVEKLYAEFLEWSRGKTN